jgi:LmbE family N-acetylglucosaminyl deacetylase
MLIQTAKLAPALAASVPTTSALLLPNSEEEPQPKRKVVVTGGHPGDPECGCGGTIARYSDLGHEVVLLYLNRGEGFCGPNELKDCARIRTAEAEKACAILKARAAFVCQYDGRSIIDAARYEEFRHLLNAEKPDVVFTHWPIDSHRPPSHFRIGS